jgi:hypothetical protein
MNTGLYSHYKGGTYQVLGVGQHSESGEQLVIYVSLDPTKHGPRLRARPLKMWDERVQWPDGSTKPRFIHIGDEIRHEETLEPKEHRCSHCGAVLRTVLRANSAVADNYYCPHHACVRYGVRTQIILRGGGVA